MNTPRPPARMVEYVLVAAGLSVATAVTTWPHAGALTTHVISHLDPLLSMWRIAWFAHAVSSPDSLLHANIFYPEPYTLLLSDATLLQSALAAPAIWGGVTLPVVYNALLWFGFVSSGVAIYGVAASLGIRRAAAIVAAMVFMLAPYRIEHIGHLELQWSAFAVLAFGALARVLDRADWKDGVALGVAVGLQFLSSVYYAVFLLPILLLLWAASLGRLPDLGRTCRAGLLSAAICALLTLPIARLYLQQSARVGGRAIDDIAMFSATPANYLASPAQNTLYGATADWLGGDERRLFPGAAALALAVVGLFSTRRRIAVAAAIVTLASFDLSLGLNGLLYPLFLEWWPPARGLRVPARYAIYVLAGVAMLAALGCERLMDRWGRTRGRAAWVVALTVAIVCVEYRSPQRHLTRMDRDAPVYRFLQQLPEAVILELPMPARSGGVRLDADYMFWSTWHWRKLVNGYSGYFPPSYQSTLTRLQSLPSGDALSLLRERDVRYILVHTAFLEPADGDLVSRLAASPALRALGSYPDWAGATVVFELLY